MMRLKRPQTIIFAGAGLLLGMVVVLWSKSVQAGPITNPGGPPFVKLGVYQGVISVVPGGAQVMEIGNNGTDIASTGNLILRPGSNSAVYVTAQDAVNEGGELVLNGAAANPGWSLDIFSNRFRIHSGGTEKLTITSAGNAALGGVTDPSARLVVANNTVGTGSSGDAIAAYANSTNAAVYAEQQNSEGWAGYFSGQIGVSGQIQLGGIDKSEWKIQVCPVETNSGCLGRYLYTTGTTRDTTATGVKFFYERASDSTIRSVNAYTQFFNPNPTCQSGYTLTTRCNTLQNPSNCVSYFTEVSGGCNQLEGEYLLYSMAQPYGNGNVCVGNTTAVVLVTNSQGPPAGTCETISAPKGKYITGKRLVAPQIGSYYLQTYELR